LGNSVIEQSKQSVCTRNGRGILFSITQLPNLQILKFLMSKFAEPMSRLIDELKKLPGVGAKSAQRLAFHILRSSDEDAEALAGAVRDVKANLRLCSVCNNITDVDPCIYCTSATRNQRLVCVVEEPTNIAAIEKTKHFNGVFHVLHGAISPLHGIGPEQLRILNLLSRVDSGNIDEVILATNPTVEGEATAVYLSQQLKRAGVKVTRIAMGIPVGSDIEYTDEITMLKAMEGRRDM
jgi:recombination protein RecR